MLVITAIVASDGLIALYKIDASNIFVKCRGKQIRNKIIQKEIAKDILINSVKFFPVF
tara:strand:+ start:112 stop:285 length:174 start_codon:yes stop_codon:yes gene_type:complete